MNWNQLWLLGEMYGWGDAARNRKQMELIKSLVPPLPSIVLPVTRGGGSPVKEGPCGSGFAEFLPQHHHVRNRRWVWC